MRIWIFLLLAAVPLGWVLLTNIGAAQALSDISARPILSLAKDGTRVPVQQSGNQANTGEARLQGGTGVLFGYATAFTLPTGETVTCTIRFSSLSCLDGWTPERAN